MFKKNLALKSNTNQLAIKMEKDVIIALDFKNSEETFNFLNHFDQQLYVKVGMELFYKEGQEIISKIKDRGHKIFLDLKLHDIPTTVYKAMKNIGKLNVDMVNLHTLGGKEMMNSAIQGLEEGSLYKRPLCIGVTILTSMSKSILKNELLINEDINETILHYAKNAKDSQLDGVVCSPLESSIIHSHLGMNFLTVTPGIRLENNKLHDQVRVTTPRHARLLGSDYIVVGRTITNDANPVNIYEIVKNQFINEGEINGY